MDSCHGSVRLPNAAADMHKSLTSQVTHWFMWRTSTADVFVVCSRLHPEGIEAGLPQHELPADVRLCGKLDLLDKLLVRLHASGHKACAGIGMIVSGWSYTKEARATMLSTVPARPSYEV